MPQTSHIQQPHTLRRQSQPSARLLLADGAQLLDHALRADHAPGHQTAAAAAADDDGSNFCQLLHIAYFMRTDLLVHFVKLL